MSMPYRISEPAALKSRNTLGVEASAACLIEIHDNTALPEVLALPQVRQAAPLILGGGSNLLFAGNPAGAVIRFASRAISVLGETHGKVRVRAEAGMPWHEFVLWTLQHGLSGLENLALIPGTVGAAPIQNIGAYGVEVGEYVDVVETYLPPQQQRLRMDRADCRFAYRDSVFKQQAGRYIVTAVEFLLPRTPQLRLEYAGIADELAAMDIRQPSASDVAQAVVRIRQRKLPDPAVVGNAGSFFKNPIIAMERAEALLAQHPGLPVFRGNDAQTRKISAAWMIEACGWKGFREGDGGVSPVHALVLVNYGEASGPQMLSIGRRIATSVEERFGIEIEPEPIVIGARW